MTSDTKIKIRPFFTKDAQSCAGLYIKIFGMPPWNEIWTLAKASRLINKLTKKKRFFGFAAECDSVTVGYLLGHQINTSLARIYYIDQLFVDTAYQNMKIGRCLINSLFNDLAKKEVLWVFLLTRGNSPAEAFYKQIGFKRLVPRVSIKKKIIMYYRD